MTLTAYHTKCLAQSLLTESQVFQVCKDQRRTVTYESIGENASMMYYLLYYTKPNKSQKRFQIELYEHRSKHSIFYIAVKLNQPCDNLYGKISSNNDHNHEASLYDCPLYAFSNHIYTNIVWNKTRSHMALRPRYDVLHDHYERLCHPSAAITAYSAEIDIAVARDCDKLVRYLTSDRHEIDAVVVAVARDCDKLVRYLTSDRHEIDAVVVAVARDCDKLVRYLTSDRHEIDAVVVAVALGYSLCLYQSHNSYYARSLSESFPLLWIYCRNVSFDRISVDVIAIKPVQRVPKFMAQ
uniref:Uncharacterized protein n=1 Tax=Glossina pallidipes TaxID=7398 RepID=A0A1B0AHC7_GLOPL